MYLTVMANNTTPVHRPLIEEYIGTWCGWCIRGLVGMELMRETFGDDFIGVAYHNGDAMQITTKYPNNVTGFPSAFIERNYSVDPLYGFGDVSGEIIDVMQEIAAMEVIAGIDVTAKWTSDAKTAIDVNVTSYFTSDYNNADYAIEVMLIADDLYGSGSSWNQRNYYSGYTEYAQDYYLAPWVREPETITGVHFNDVLVGFSGVIDNSLPTSIVAYDEYNTNYTFELSRLPKPSLIQNKDNLHVIAVVVYKNNRQAINANRCFINDYVFPCDSVFEVNGYYYKKTSENEAELTLGPIPYQNAVIIPSEVTYQGVTYLVTGISDNAFYGSEFNNLTIPVTIKKIAHSTFYGINLESVFITGEGEWQAGALPEGIKTLHIDDTVTGVKGMQANPEKIYSYATTPPVCDENSFTGYDAELHVPASSMAAYFTAPYWCNFTNIIGDAVMATGLTLDQDNIKMEVGSQLTLTATIMPASAMNQTVIWSTTNSTVAIVDNGVVTAVAPGECNIVATCGNKQAICHLTVLEHLIYITLDQHETRLLPNHLITLTPTITPVETDLVVTSSNPAVAAARLAGNTIQVMGITEGTATIYVNSADGYAFSDSCLVEVYTERGDVNCDGFVNISDATSLIDALLDGGNVYSTENADCNNDGKVTITDLTRLIDALLGGTVLPEKERAMAPVPLEEMSKPSVPISIKHWQAGCF